MLAFSSPKSRTAAHGGSCRWVSLGFWVLMCAGCTARSVGTPQATLRSYTKALADDDARAAYQLFSPTLQRSLPYEEFEKQWRENGSERALQRQQILAQLSSRSSELTERAELRLSQGSAVQLVAARTMVGKSWQLVDANLQAVAAGSPQDVLKLLLLAVEKRNYPALLRLLSTEERKALEAQLSERIDRLRAALVKPTIDVRGDRARIEYDPRFFVDLVREGDSWRIADLN